MKRLMEKQIILPDKNNNFMVQTIDQSLDYHKKTVKDFKRQYLTSKLRNIVELLKWTHLK